MIEEIQLLNNLEEVRFITLQNTKSNIFALIRRNQFRKEFVVKIGDIATNKHGKSGKVIAIGTIGNDWKDMKKFATNSDIPTLIKTTPSGTKGYLDNLIIIAVKYNNGRTEVWTYDSDNAYVSK